MRGPHRRGGTSANCHEAPSMNRVGKPAEAAATVAFLLGDKASFITGQDLAIDGGSLSAAWPANYAGAG
ncbi:SDR family oxidoreductase [Sorangium sp. So ce1097]|uniref:SDR family oxidoreductase n=1 Tax=Sorangium sp. So ce1097 TaxID=3133330 RepID=UPI003F623EFC